jgi:putative Ig domain-containing protein
LATGLPPGLSINSATGRISGTPTTFGGWGLHVTVTDSGSPAQSISAADNFVIRYPGVHIAATSLPNGTPTRVCFMIAPPPPGRS